MAINQLYTATATVSTTEYSLTNNSTTLTAKTDVGILQAWIDLNAMAAGDQYEIKFYEKTISGGTQRLVEVWTVTGAQAKPLFTIPSLIVMWGWEVTMKKLVGTDRSIVWSLRAVQ